ncbi:hypothetical protein CC80DRAFT_265652 [Byssothecium circinans]|uniref:BZIP domain-containing protein n=1 Tax=Byssothecium circinans TaxID=147558 RepID=A0A6A5U813_9PLEO|nr:hypothetical protein CC80DRAFT_265652 [Byssothecium circinans]
MDPSSAYEMWLPQSGAYMQPHQAAAYNPMDQIDIQDISNVPSLTGSPASTYDHQFSTPMTQEYYPRIADDTMHYAYPIPIAESELGSDHDASYCSPPPQIEMYPHVSAPSAPAERQHTTSGRRRAQNRAAQRAFRERKEKHARDLEIQLAALEEKYKKLDSSHTELKSQHERLQRIMQAVVQDQDDAEGEDDDGKTTTRRSSSTDPLSRKLLDILNQDFKIGFGVKKEGSSSP